MKEEQQEQEINRERGRPRQVELNHWDDGLPCELLSKVVEYLAISLPDILNILSVSHSLHHQVTRNDNLWKAIVKKKYGGLVEKLRITGNYYDFFLRRKRCQSQFSPILQPKHFHEMACEVPPNAFWSSFYWILEVRDEKERNLIYSAMMDMHDPLQRGLLFTSGGGAAIVGTGLQLEKDILHRLPRRPSPTSLKDEAAASPPVLLVDLFVYDNNKKKTACFVSARLHPDRPPRWTGRYWDGPFVGVNGIPSARIAMDESHILRVLPTVDMADWKDRVYLLQIQFDLNICQCDVNECVCTQTKSGMISEEAHWILLHDLLTNKFAWY